MDAGTLAILAGLLLAIAAGGYAWGRWRAVGWLGVAPWAAFALATDAAWWSGLWDRSDEYEPLPTSMFVFPLWIPLCCLVVTVAVLARRARRGSGRGLADKV